MMDKGCDTGRAICPHKPMCMWNCHFTEGLKGEPRFEDTVITQPHLVRELKPWPVVLEEAEPVSDMWQIVASIAVGFLLFGVALLAAVLFATGAWVWSLLI
jgi:hypothetical protein